MKPLFFSLALFLPALVFSQTGTPALSAAQLKQMKMLRDAQMAQGASGNSAANANSPAQHQQQEQLQQQQQKQPAIQPQQPPVLNTRDGTTLPADFEFISISPYFKNKAKLGKMIATVQSDTGQILGTVTGDFGDCKTCVRGASLKGKIGIRVYGKDLRALTISRKQSSSIQIINCPTEVTVAGGVYVCEFSTGKTKMKLNLRIDP